MTVDKDLYDSILLSLYESNPEPGSMSTFNLKHFRQKWNKNWEPILDQLAKDKLIFIHRYEGTSTYKITPKGLEYIKSTIQSS